MIRGGRGKGSARRVKGTQAWDFWWFFTQEKDSLWALLHAHLIRNEQNLIPLLLTVAEVKLTLQWVTLKKKKIKCSSYIRKFRPEQLQRQSWGFLIYEEMRKLAQIFSHIWGVRKSYITLQPLPSEFPYIWGKFNFLFYQCIKSQRLSVKYICQPRVEITPRLQCLKNLPAQ